MSRTRNLPRLIRARSDTLWLVVCAVLVSFVVYSLNAREGTQHDGFAAVPLAASLVHDGDLRLDEYRDVPGFATHYTVVSTDGHLVGYFPWPVALFAAPVIVCADLAEAIGIGPGADGAIDRMGARFALLQQMTAAASTALAVGGVLALIRSRRPDLSRAATCTLTAVFAFGTAAWSTAAVQLWQHGPSLCATSWGLYFLDRTFRTSAPSRRTVIAAAACMTLAFYVRPTNVLGLVGATAAVLVVRRSSTVGWVAGCLLVMIPVSMLNLSTYGAFLQPYGSTSRLHLSDQVPEAIAANLVSPARGLFVFSPVAIWAVVETARRARLRQWSPLSTLAAAVLPVHLVVISMFPHWWGGFSFGPRFMTDALPYVVILALPETARAWKSARRRVAVLAAFAAAAVTSVAINGAGAVAGRAACWSVDPVNVDQHPERVWDWRDPLVTRAFRELSHDPHAAIFQPC